MQWFQPLMFCRSCCVLCFSQSAVYYSFVCSDKVLDISLLIQMSAMEITYSVRAGEICFLLEKKIT